MGVLDDYFDPDQFQDSGGLFGRLLSLHPELNFQSDAGADPQNPPPGPVPSAPPMSPFISQGSPSAMTASPAADADISQTPSSFDIGAHLNAGFQKWAQTPAGNPFAAIANGIAGLNAVQPTDAAFIGPPAPSTQTGDFGNRLGAALQSWAQTPSGNPFAAIANGISGFNTGQASAAATSSPATSFRSSVQDPADNSHTAAQNLQSAPIASINPQLQSRRPGTPRGWPR